MSHAAKLAALLMTGSLCVAGAPAFAASAMTDAFVANVRPNVTFLNDSSRLALQQSTSPRIRTFAHREAVQQTIAGNELVAWTQTNTAAGEAVAVGAPVVAPVGAIVAAPLDVAATVTNGVVTGVDDVVTGRSVAIDQPPPLVVTPAPAPAVVPGAGLLPSEQTDMDRLRAASGSRFDTLYRETQSDGLHQLAALYRDYIQNGDDPALRAMAVQELPKINHRLAELRAL